MLIRRPFAAAAIAALTLTGVGATAGTAAAAPPAGSPLGSYIVTLAQGNVPSQVAALASARLGGQVGYVYTEALDGFSVTVPAALADRLRTLPGVVHVEQDKPIHASSPTVQQGATWGLDRIDQVGLPLSGTYSYTAAGTGVTAYIIDTGIQFANTDFGGRAKSGYDAVNLGTPADDCNGHGTHVAGTVGGSKYGVAKAVKLVAVRVLDCNGSGTISGVIAGVNWVTANHTAGAPAVANMSLGGGVSDALDAAITASIDDGVTYAVAAGNGNSLGVPQDACTSSPARVPGALTVGATDKTDKPASFSNYGACVDLFAPGVGITSDWYSRRSNTATNTISGTSMATPHVAGVAALYLQGNPAASPDAVGAAVKAATTKDAFPSTTTPDNNDLLFTDY
ncbi:MAG: putative secreted serine protease [Blastococcus sp.]|nr:putative secreted serine protease [Blastococcus sp.]